LLDSEREAIGGLRGLLLDVSGGAQLLGDVVYAFLESAIARPPPALLNERDGRERPIAGVRRAHDVEEPRYRRRWGRRGGRSLRDQSRRGECGERHQRADQGA